MTITSHWLSSAVRDPISGGSPMPVRRLAVIHYTAGASALSSIESMRRARLSAHLVIDRDGTVYQCRPFNRTCSHAGASRWRDPRTGRTHTRLNSCSIGIELANGGSSFPTRFSALPPTSANGRLWETFDPRQLAALTEAVAILVATYHLDDIRGHSEICTPPGRKPDPGPAFPMHALRKACDFPA